MAGAGYKLFNTGDVLTAAQVNTYLMEQTVMVFDDATARTAALSGVVSEGMISYLKDTNAVEVYNGSAWVASDDPNAIQNTIVDAKGDLIAASAADTPARLAVGNDGETLLADSSSSVGLRWAGNYAAGKNKVINGDFGIWQRGTSFTTSAAEAYTADRWVQYSNGSMTTSRQTFTAGAAPVAGYEGTYFYRLTTSATNVNASLRQKIEDVRVFAGETVTLSYWIKGSGAFTATPTVRQNFGSGGSASVDTTNGTVSVTTSWTRVSKTFTVPSISGKTIGTGSCLEIFLYVFGDTIPTSGTIDIWGVQIESGSVATAFQTATGTLAGELAACQRYYWRNTAGNAYGLMAVSGYNPSATAARMSFVFPVPMRTEPTVLDFSNVAYQDNGDTVYGTSAITLDSVLTTKYTASVNATIAGGTANRSGRAIANNNAAAYVGFSSEL